MGKLTFGIEAIHQGLHYIQFVFNGKVYEVSIKKDVIWWSKLCVVLKEKGGRNWSSRTEKN